MKRTKKTFPKIKEVTIRQYEIQCPYCKSFLHGGFNENTIQYKCGHCENAIIIEWDKAVLVHNF
jgi:DNA-directed RNA polymerase subunit RPC12/RpoP